MAARIEAVLEDLQRIADTLAIHLDRAVAIDDLSFRLLVYTPHVGVVDRVRAEVVLTRQAPAEVAKWVRSFGIAKARGPVRVPPNDGFGLLSRVCVPIRAQGLHFGWLWLIDPDETLTPSELEAAEAAAEEAGLVLFWDRASGQYTDSRARELLRDLLSDDHALREMAARELMDGGYFTSDPDVVALVVRLAHPGEVLRTPLPESARMSLASTLDEIAGLLPPRESLRLVRPDHGLLITRGAHLQRHPELLDRIHAIATKELQSAEGDVVIGAGPPTCRLADAHTSYKDALHAARVAEVVPSFRPVAHFANLGVYAMLVDLPLSALGDSALHPGIARLRAADPELVATLELFLDLAGDTVAVADQLGLHRSSVYHRIHRVEQIAEVNLSSGEDRLALHLSLRLARLMNMG